MWQAIIDLAYEHIVVPIVLLVMNIVGPFLADIAQKIILAFMVLPLWIIRFLEEAVDIFSGVRPLDSGTAQGQTIFDYFLGQSVVTTVFWGITLISAALCIGFSIIAVIRSMGDLEGRRPVGKILGSVGKSMLTFLIIPFMCIASISLAGLVLRQVSLLIDTGGGASEPVSVTGALFMISATPETVPAFTWGEMDWNKDDSFFFTSARTSAANTPEDTREQLYNELHPQYMTGEKGTGWDDIAQIQEDFDVFRLIYPGNAIVSILTSWFYVIMMLMIMMIFLRRIYELILLYLVSPFFVSVMPLDEGEKFRGWREQFISTVIAGFGSVFMLKIFVILLPLIWNDSFKMHSDPFTNVVLKALLTAGGIFATFKSHTLISTIVSDRGAASERDSAGMIMYAYNQMSRNDGYQSWGGSRSSSGQSGSGEGGGSGNKNPNLAGNSGLLVRPGDIDFSKPLTAGADIGGGSSGTGSGPELFKRDVNIQSLRGNHLVDSSGTDPQRSFDIDPITNPFYEETNPFTRAIDLETNPFTRAIELEKILSREAAKNETKLPTGATVTDEEKKLKKEESNKGEISAPPPIKKQDAPDTSNKE